MTPLGRSLDRFRQLFADSELRLPFATEEEIAARWGTEPHLKERLSAALQAAIVRPAPSDFTAQRLNETKRALILEERFGLTNGDLRKAVHAIFNHVSWRHYASLDDEAWIAAMDLARALVRLGEHFLLNLDDTAPARSARRLADVGFQVSLSEGQFLFADGELERATATVQKKLDQIGIVGAVHRVVQAAAGSERKAFGMVLFGRRSLRDEREPILPYGFLLNLALRSPQVADAAADADELFASACETARNIVAVLDLETYYLPVGLIVTPLRIEDILRRAAQYEHLIGIKQWPPSLVGSFLFDFFDASKITAVKMRSTLGWAVDDAIKLWLFMAPRMTEFEPWCTSVAELAGAGLKPEVLTRLLQVLKHPAGTVNAGYRSPLDAATDKDAWRLAFVRPFVELTDGSLLIPFPAAAGFSFYEALMGALFDPFPNQAKKLLGDGTEAVVLGALRRAGFPVAAAAAKYRSPVEGEIDAAVETDNAIILLESKAKAPTRVTMAGTSAEALLDYTGSVLESQVQALQHEILLRKDGMIFLIDRPRLYWRSRKVIRISVTLHDHGAMQDSLTVGSVTNALLNARFDPKPGYEKADRIQKLQKKNELLAQATERLTKLGVDPHAQKATCFSFSVVQLAVFLYESCNPDDFVARISSPLVFGTQNPLSDYVERIQRGMAPPARSP